MNPPRCVWPARAVLGEGPLWSVAEQALYWVDVKRPAVHRFDPGDGSTQIWPMRRRVSCLAFRARGGLVAAGEDGFGFLELDGGRWEPRADPESAIPGNRFNDGKCDAAGRFWAGTMDDAEQARRGSLYRLDPDGSCRVMDEGYRVTNGPAFSLDGTRMYHSDSAERRVYLFEVDGGGAIAGKRVFLRFDGSEGHPDGMTVDAEDHLWVAHYGGSAVSRYTPDGALCERVSFPVQRVTSCAFGGADLRTLFVTTATQGMSADECIEQPAAGGLFALRTRVAGVPPALFGG